MVPMTPPSANPLGRGVIVPSEHKGRTLLRGSTKRCGVCGQGHLFHRWFRMAEQCPRCGLEFERIDGHWTGDIGINTVVSFTALAFVLFGGLLVTWPDPPAGPLVVACLLTAVLVPLVFLPFSKTVWLAIDLVLRPLEPGEVRDGFGPQSGDSTPPAAETRR